MIAKNAIIAALTAPLLLAACASAPQIPLAAKPVVICIYDTLNATPGITAVHVYVLDEGGVVVEYGYRTSKGLPRSTDLYISDPKGIGRFQYVGDFLDSLDDPVGHMYEHLNSKCHAEGRWGDQVVITTGPQRVEVRRPVVLPK